MCILAPNDRTPEERREAGYGTQLTSFLRFGGVVDLGQEWQTNHFKEGIESQENNDPELSIELGFELTSFDWLEAEILFAIEENGRRHLVWTSMGLERKLGGSIYRSVNFIATLSAAL
jgi:hypothetical protein